jgi:hypothetical protein
LCDTNELIYIKLLAGSPVDLSGWETIIKANVIQTEPFNFYSTSAGGQGAPVSSFCDGEGGTRHRNRSWYQQMADDTAVDLEVILKYLSSGISLPLPCQLIVSWVSS